MRFRVPNKGAMCTLQLPDENDDLTIIPLAVYVMLGKHGLKDGDGWYDAWMLRMVWPQQDQVSFFSALPERVKTHETKAKAVKWVKKYNP